MAVKKYLPPRPFSSVEDLLVLLTLHYFLLDNRRTNVVIFRARFQTHAAFCFDHIHAHQEANALHVPDTYS